MQKCLVLNMAGTVWAAKQVILDKVYKVGAYIIGLLGCH